MRFGEGGVAVMVRATKSIKAPSVGGQGIIKAPSVGGQGVLDALATPAFAVDRRLRYTAFNRAHAAVMRRAYGTRIALGRSVLKCHTIPRDGELTLSLIHISEPTR